MFSLVVIGIIGFVVTVGAQADSCCLPDLFETTYQNTHGLSYVSSTPDFSPRRLVVNALDVHYNGPIKRVVFDNSYTMYLSLDETKVANRTFRVIQDFNLMKQYTIDLESQACTTQALLSNNFHKMCTDVNQDPRTSLQAMEIAAVAPHFNITMGVLLDTTDMLLSCSTSRNFNNNKVILESTYFQETPKFDLKVHAAFGEVSLKIADASKFEIPSYCI